MWVCICSEHRHKIDNEHINPNQSPLRRKMWCQPRTTYMLDSCSQEGWTSNTPVQENGNYLAHFFKLWFSGVVVSFFFLVSLLAHWRWTPGTVVLLTLFYHKFCNSFVSLKVLISWRPMIMIKCQHLFYREKRDFKSCSCRKHFKIRSFWL